MQSKLQEYMDTNKYTFRKILLELDKVKMICAADRPGGCRLLNPPTKVQREILVCLGLPVNSFDVIH